MTSFDHGWRPELASRSKYLNRGHRVSADHVAHYTIAFTLSHLFGHLAKFKSSSHCDSDKLCKSSLNYHYCMLFQSISFHSIQLFYIPSYFIPFYCSTLPVTMPLTKIFRSIILIVRRICLNFHP